MNNPTTATMTRGITLQPRQPDFTFSTDMPDDWFEGDAGLTAFWNALGVVASLAEARFIETGRWLLGRLDNPAALDETTRFIQQEAQHSVVHARFNRLLEQREYPVAQASQLVKQALEELERRFGRDGMTAMTVAAEQTIGVMGHVVMRQPEIMAGAAQAPRELWLWHLYEEVEHHAALHDAWRETIDDPQKAGRERAFGGLLMLTLVATLLPAISIVFCRHHHPGKQWQPRTWARLMAQLFAKKGIWRSAMSNLKAIARPDFHPFDLHEPSALVDSCRPLYTREEWSIAVKPLRPASEDHLCKSPSGWRRYLQLLGYSGYMIKMSWRILRIA